MSTLVSAVFFPHKIYLKFYFIMSASLYLQHVQKSKTKIDADDVFEFMVLTMFNRVSKCSVFLIIPIC